VALDSFERKKAEDELSNSESRFRMLAENAIDVIYRYNVYPENKYEYVSPSVYEVTGYTQQEFYDDPYLGFRMVYDDDKPLIGDSENIIKSQESIKGLRQSGMLLRWVRKDGRIIWTETRNKPIYNEQGKLIAIEGISRDITNRVKLENDLIESKETYKTLVEALPSGVLIFVEGKIVYANQIAFEIIGIKNPNVLMLDSISIFDFVLPEFHDILKQRQLEILNGEAFHSLEIKAQKADGKIIDIEVKSVLVQYMGKMGIQTIFQDITYRKTFEQTLRESEEKFRLLSIAAPIGIFLANKEGKLVYVNNKLQQITALSKQELTDGKWPTIFHPDDSNRIIKEIQDKIKQESDYSAEFRIITPDRKELCWVKFQITPILLADGSFSGWVGTVEDVTSRINSEFLIRESEQRFKLLSDAAMEGIVITENDKIIDANDRFVKMHGYNSSKDIIMMELAAFIHPSDKGVTKFFSKNSFDSIEFKTRKNDGTVIYVEAQRINMPYHGRTVQITIITDITERKHYELELERSQNNYKSLIEYSPDGIFIYDEQDDVIFANPAALKMIGAKSLQELKQRTIFHYVLPEFHDRVRKKREKARKGESVPFTDYRIKRENGTGLQIEAKPISFSYFGMPCVLVFCHDITAKTELLKEQVRAQIAEETNKILQDEITQHMITQRKLEEAQWYTKNIIDSSLDMICAADKDGKVVEFNRAAQLTFGYRADEVIGKDVSILYAYDMDMEDRHNELIKQGKFEGEVINRRKNGEEFLSYVTAATLYNGEGEMVGTMGVSRDITRIKEAERKLKASEARYRAIYNQAYIGIARVGLTKGEFIEANQRLCDILGYTSDELCKMTTWDITHPEDLHTNIDRKRFIQNRQDKMSIEKRYIHNNGSVIYANLTISLVKDAAGNPDYFVSVYEDITERKRQEELIKMQAAKLNAIIESSSHIIWTIDNNYCLTSFNMNYTETVKSMYGINPHVGLSVNQGRMISTPEYNDFWNKKYEQVFEGHTQNFETCFADKFGKETWREMYLNPIFGIDGNVVEVSGIGHDITEKKLSEGKIKQSLKEKEVLLKEVHHRVKNNLQVISSILNLQSSYVKDKKVIEMLRESQNRIKSMSFIHESLYQTKDFSNINFSEYVINLSKNLLHSYRAYEGNIDLKLEVDKIFLNLDLAIPCGLIINELVSNAFKYAFPDQRNGFILISVKQRKDIIAVEIKDNGIGLPDTVDYRNTQSLGLQLVITLVEQLNGEINLSGPHGTKYTIKFKQNQTKRQ